MGMGHWQTDQQQEFWIATKELSQTPRHVFYERLNELLAEARFDAWLEQLCRPHYSRQGRGSIAPGRYFRMLMVGDFEGIDSQRGIAWWSSDSLSLKSFLGCQPNEATSEHSSLTRITSRLPLGFTARCSSSCCNWCMRMVCSKGRRWAWTRRRWKPTQR